MINKYLVAGLSVIPITPGAKYPAIKWDVFQERLATLDEAAGWSPPIGIVCGKVSGGLVCIDFDDGGSQFDAWINLIQAENMALALALLVQQTPSGGYHVVYRCPTAEIGNEKLALLPQPVNGKNVLIETRGQGGQFLAYPSPGYVLVQNDFLSIPVVKQESHDFMIETAKSFNQKVKEKQNPVIPVGEFGLSPFDDFDSKHTPVDLLCSHGWTVVFDTGGVVRLRRPGKDRGISATWNHIPDRFYVFTTNTNFENEHIYKASAVYAILEHDGDWKAAARGLIEKGFGTSRKIQNTSHIDGTDDKDIKTFSQLGESWVKLMDRKENTDFGFPALNSMAKQFSQGEVFILAARSGVGKTTLGMTILRNISNSENKFCLFMSLEMSGEMIFQRSGMIYISRENNVQYSFGDDNTESTIITLKTNKDKRDKISVDFGKVLVVDRAKVSIDAISNYLEIARSKYGQIDFVVIDYLGYIYDGNAGSNYEKVSRIAKGAKEFSKESHSRVMLLAQTSRAGEDGFEPVKLNHLRDSGAIEESADYLLGMWASRSEPNRIHCEMLKNRWHARGRCFDLINNDLNFVESESVLHEKGKRNF